MVVVLVILGILMAVIAPGMQSAFAEQKLRSDAHELSLMVKTGMIRCEEDHRAYVLQLNATSLSLAPLQAAKPDETAAPPNPSADASAASADEAVTEDWHLTAQNQLLLPDAKAAGNWQPIESAQWIFRPGELCPATDVLFKRGDSQLRLSFNALTGNVEKEWSYFP
jgi:type II secretory pathway pseudopilin PulG